MKASPHPPAGRFSVQSERWWCRWRVGQAAPTSGIPWRGSSTRNPPARPVTQSLPELEKYAARQKQRQKENWNQQRIRALNHAEVNQNAFELSAAWKRTSDLNPAPLLLDPILSEYWIKKFRLVRLNWFCGWTVITNERPPRSNRPEGVYRCHRWG